MRIAIVQPYAFPWLGYYQLASFVDTFVFFDDVNYIKKGYINRNSVLVNGEAHRFTLPVTKASQNRWINQHEFGDVPQALFSLLKANYSKSKFFADGNAIVESVLADTNRNVAHIASQSICSVLDHAAVDFHCVFSSQINYDREASASGKILSICKALNAKSYWNPTGGRALYDSAEFSRQGVELNFFEPVIEPYPQLTQSFVPNLSAIDPLLSCSRETLHALITSGSLRQ